MAGRKRRTDQTKDEPVTRVFDGVAFVQTLGISEEYLIARSKKKSTRPVLKQLIERGGTANQIDLCESLLYQAAANGDSAGVKFLLEQGAVAHGGARGLLAPLFGGVLSGSTKVVELLVRHGCPINEQDSTMKSTVLHLAAATSNVAVCKILLEAGADATLRNKSRLSALDAIVISAKRTQLEKLFRTHGFEPEFLQATSHRGRKKVIADRAKRNARRPSKKVALTPGRKPAGKKKAAKKKK